MITFQLNMYCLLLLKKRRYKPIIYKISYYERQLITVFNDSSGNQRVTSQNPEATYEALEKYGRDLVAEVKAGKLTLLSAAIVKFAV